MDSAQFIHNGDCREDASADQFISPQSLDMYDVFGESYKLPRIGDQYQAVIPPLMTASDYLCVTENPNDQEITTVDGSHDFCIGLSVSIMWINNEAINTLFEQVESFDCSNDISTRPSKSEFSGEDHIIMDFDDLKHRDVGMDIALDNGMDVTFEIHENHRGTDCIPVPGSLCDLWSDVEEAGFLLGLYIFGKNLIKVERFIESKQMGDILAHYYGTFYQSRKYRKWSQCWKRKSKNCIYGRKIFKGPRQHELLSRFLPLVSEECQSTLKEVSKSFEERKMSLEKYVSTLKATVGLSILVEAVGIGKGKQDLTRITLEQLKLQQVPLRPDISTGKSCSMLTSFEIMNFLTGDLRLSKARSSDLFWESVWPRLLGRGWHSEQPKNYGCAAGSKRSLVFLVPGIKKFSRRKLVKGNHYFDSVSDILSKVSSDPGLIELDTESDKGYVCQEDNRCIAETELEHEDMPDSQSHCYLKPRVPVHAKDDMKFTVVDTSWDDQETRKVRQVRSLPVNVMKNPASKRCSKEDDGDSSEDVTDESDSSDTLCLNQQKNNVSKLTKVHCCKRNSSDMNDSKKNASQGVFPIVVPDSSNVVVKFPKDHNTKMCIDMRQRKPMKCQFSKKLKPENENHIAPATKRCRRLTASNHGETGCGTNYILVDAGLKASSCSNDFVSSENILSYVDASQEKLTSTRSCNGIPVNCSKGILGDSSFVAELSHEKTQTQMLFDLSLPTPQESEAGGPLMMECTEEIQQDPTTEQPYDPNVLTTSICTDSPEQQPKVNSRRQSTRNRPLTTRALEALACGFLNARQKRKCKNAFSQENSQHACANVKGTENCRLIIDCKLEGRGNGISNSNGDMSSEFMH